MTEPVAPAAAPGPLPVSTPSGWQTATVVGVRPETTTAKTFRLSLPEPVAHLAGQHYVLRLTAPDGYTASRSSSVASAPDGTNQIELTVELLPDGEVSSFLHDDVIIGDELEVRGPIGGWFVWRGDTPALLIGGGSGIVPLMAMLRLARRVDRADLVRLIVSVRRPGDLYYHDELPGPETTIVYTRTASLSSTRSAGRLGPDDLPPDLAPDTTAFVCGSSGFADAATALLEASGFPSDRIRVERFGATQ
jgi:ferredoxin-NADP reductase